MLHYFQSNYNSTIPLRFCFSTKWANGSSLVFHEESGTENLYLHFVFSKRREKIRHRKLSKFCKPNILIWWVLLSISWEKLILKTSNKTEQNKNKHSSGSGNGASLYARCARNVFFTKRKTKSGIPKLWLSNFTLDFNPS